MKLPAFEDFMQALHEEKFKPKNITFPVNLNKNPKHSEVVEFSRVTAHLTTLNLLEQYHLWLCEQLTILEPLP